MGEGGKMGEGTGRDDCNWGSFGLQCKDLVQWKHAGTNEGDLVRTSSNGG